MNKDRAATITGAVAGLSQLLGLFGIGIPVEVLQAVGGAALIILGWLTNKK